MIRKITRISVVCVLLSTALTGCLTQQEAANLERRLAYLEQGNRKLTKRSAILEQRLVEDREKVEKIDGFDENLKNREQALREQFADLRIGVSDLRKEQARLRGMVEESAYGLEGKLAGFESKLNVEKAGLEKFEQDLAHFGGRLVRLEAFMGFEPSEKLSPPPDETAGGNGAAPTEDQQYVAAKKILDGGDARASREKFQAFIKRHPKSKHADNAQFWIGETYYLEKWYEKAILEYQKVIEKYSGGNKVPSAYLKQGMAFQKLGEKANARLILKELIKKFPGSNEAKIAKRQIKGL